MDYERLFEKWADFHDEESPKEVTDIIEREALAPINAISFMAYCAGYTERCFPTDKEE